ncbi:Probable aldehyde dehydrogenase [Mycobacteroides abscessus]|nr:Probable aldehyde dehydrogenase [Mycobacteroides abscessus]
MHTNEIQSFVGGRWISGGGQAVISVCPAFPDRVIAEGLAAGPAEFDEAAAAAWR